MPDDDSILPETGAQPAAEPAVPAADPACETTPDAAPAADATPDDAAAADEPVAEPAAPRPAELSPAQCAARLGELFPALFGTPPKPLKLKIQADIQQRAPGVFTRKALSAFLHRHTTSNAYLSALSKSTQRFDLDGQPAGELADEHREAAAAELQRRRGLHESRRAAENAARRAAEAEARQRESAEHEARRERATLLRAFETTTLTRANFCALKGIAEAGLDALLEQARRERAERPPMPPRPHGRPDDRGPRGAGPRRHGSPRGGDERGPRPEGGDRPPRGPRPAAGDRSSRAGGDERSRRGPRPERGSRGPQGDRPSRDVAAPAERVPREAAAEPSAPPAQASSGEPD